PKPPARTSAASSPCRTAHRGATKPIRPSRSPGPRLTRERGATQLCYHDGRFQTRPATMTTTLSPTLALACELIARDSTTPDDAGCQQLMGDRLAACGFTLESMRFGEVDNLCARRGTQSPALCSAGHTDVGPVGPLQRWHNPPLEPT